MAVEEGLGLLAARAAQEVQLLVGVGTLQGCRVRACPRVRYVCCAREYFAQRLQGSLEEVLLSYSKFADFSCMLYSS
jgi:hypothetical protein